MGADRAADEAVLYRAISMVKDFTCAIDGGANIGDWLAIMARRFACVHAFEPNAELHGGLLDRFGSQRHVTVHNAALWSDSKTSVRMVTATDRPETHRSAWCEVGGDIPTATIDGLSLPYCGLIKLDVEGAEMAALTGAVNTIRRCKPVVVVECSPKIAKRRGLSVDMPAHYLERMGAQEFFRLRHDRIYAWA